MYSKELLKGTLEAILLKLLDDGGKMYGYEMSQQIKRITDGKVLLKDGSLYPALHKLLKEGKLGYEEQAIGKRIRKYYYLTAQGQKAKEYHVAELNDFLLTIQRIISPVSQINTAQ